VCIEGHSFLWETCHLYQDFLTLWKRADPHLSILKEAKAE
jgi:hypothetical protein